MFSKKIWKMQVSKHSLIDMEEEYSHTRDKRLFNKIRSIAGQPSPGHPGYRIQVISGEMRFANKAT